MSLTPQITPYDYQVFGARWLTQNNHALLADEQRLGKSVQSILAAQMLAIGRILVVCRAVGRAEWASAFHRVAPGRWKTPIVFGKNSFEMSCAPTATIVSYEGVGDILAHSGAAFGLVIVDEVHYVKNLTAKRSREVLGKHGLIQRTPRMWCLTGTPTPNGLPSELWPLLYVFGATRMGYNDFVHAYCTTRHNGFGIQITGPTRDTVKLKEFRGIMAKKILRRTSSDVSIELPKVTFSTQTVEAGRVHLSMSQKFQKWTIPYDRTKELEKVLEEEMGILNGVLSGKDGPQFSEEAFLQLVAQANSISTLCLYTALQKLEPVCEIIASELESNAYAKCVIFAIHRDVIEALRVNLGRFHPVTLYGGSNPLRTEKNLKKFQNPKSNCRVFIGNILAAGTSICLDAAHHIFFLEEDWVPGNNAQAAMRCGGPNQKETVHVRNFCLPNSVDTRKQALLAEKTRAILKLYEKDTPPATGEDLAALF